METVLDHTRLVRDAGCSSGLVASPRGPRCCSGCNEPDVEADPIVLNTTRRADADIETGAMLQPPASETACSAPAASLLLPLLLLPLFPLPAGAAAPAAPCCPCCCCCWINTDPKRVAIAHAINNRFKRRAVPARRRSTEPPNPGGIVALYASSPSLPPSLPPTIPPSHHPSLPPFLPLTIPSCYHSSFSPSLPPTIYPTTIPLSHCSSLSLPSLSRCFRSAVYLYKLFEWKVYK